MLRTDIDQVRNLALKDPISNCFILSRLNDLSKNSWSLQNEISVFENNKLIEYPFLPLTLRAFSFDTDILYKYSLN